MFLNYFFYDQEFFEKNETIFNFKISEDKVIKVNQTQIILQQYNSN